MSANLLEIYGSVGGFAKVNAEKATAVSARIAEVLQEGCRLVADGAAFHADLSARSLSAVAKSKSPEDVIVAQREWLEVAVQRLATDLKTGIDLTGKLLTEASSLKPVAEIAPVVAVPAPVAVAVPAPVAVAAPAPVIEAAPAPIPVVEEVVEAAPVVEVAPAVEAESAAPVLVTAPVEAVEAAPVVEEVVEAAPVAVEASKAVAKAPVRGPRRGKSDKSPVVAAE